jgi:hypothetical protein
MSIVPLFSRTRILAAIASIGLAVVVAAPARAEGNNPPGVPANDCPLTINGQTGYYVEGTKLTAVGPRGGSGKTYVCKAGSWNETSPLGGTLIGPVLQSSSYATIQIVP